MKSPPTPGSAARWLLTLGAALAASCAVDAHSEAVDAARFGVPAAWLAAMRAAEVTSPARMMLHASHTCDLQVDGRPLHVVDLREVLPNMPAPRGINHVVLLDRKGAVVRALPYADERPLACDGDRLLLWSAMSAPDGGEGNVLVFSDGGRGVRAEQVALDALPWATR